MYAKTSRMAVFCKLYETSRTGSTNDTEPLPSYALKVSALCNRYFRYLNSFKRKLLFHFKTWYQFINKFFGSPGFYF